MTKQVAVDSKSAKAGNNKANKAPAPNKSDGSKFSLNTLLQRSKLVQEQSNKVAYIKQESESSNSPYSKKKTTKVYSIAITITITTITITIIFLQFNKGVLDIALFSRTSRR